MHATEVHDDDDTKLQKLWSNKNKVGLLDNYAFGEFYQRLIYSVSGAVEKQEGPDKYDRLCRSGFRLSADEQYYSGDQNCRHNVARALQRTHRFLIEKISPK